MRVIKIKEGQKVMSDGAERGEDSERVLAGKNKRAKTGAKNE